MMKHLSLLLTTTALFLLANIAQAQNYTPSNRTPQADNSIGTVVNPTGANNFNIDGGLQRGQNLFHSFTDFSIPTGGAANFTNPQGNQSIITRVTGNFFSDLNGTLNTNGANFLLINPNGVVFGTDARLNVGKAFVTSTANGIDFVDTAGRSYNFGVNKTGDAPLISIAPNVAFNPARLIMGASNPGSKGIENYGTLKTNNPGQYIGLIGGDVTFNGGRIDAPGGRVELGGLSALGTVTLGVDADNFRAQFPTNVPRGDVSLTNQARVNVAGAGGGDIAINARNVEISSGSSVRGGIETGLGTPESVAGDIKLNATQNILFVDANSGIANNVRLNSIGNGGNIIIDAGSLSLENGTQIEALTFGRGNAGNVTVKAKDGVSIAGDTYIFTSVEAGGVGAAGNIDITAGFLSLQRSGQLGTFTRGATDTQPAGQGNAGNVTVKASGSVDIAGTMNDIPSAINSNIGTGTIGNGGNITIDASSFSLRDGAKLSASTSGQGSAGNVKVIAKNASLIGQQTTILSSVEPGGVGLGGNIDIMAGVLSLRDGAQILSITREANDTQPAGQGNAGNITVKVAGAVDIDKSAIFSFISMGTVGNGGDITIDSGSFSLQNGSQVGASTFGQGNAGNVKVMVQDTAFLTGIQTGILSTVEAGAVGKGGNIEIAAGALSIQDAAQLVTFTRGASDSKTAGQGNAGNVTVKVSGSVNISGSKDIFPGGIRSNVEPGTFGNGGDITIDASSFSLRDGAQLSSATLGQGNAGTITVNATNFVTIAGKNGNFTSALLVDSQSPTGTAGDIIVISPKITLDGGGIGAESTSGNGGNINIKQADLLLLRRGGQITTNAGGTAQAGGNGGNININSKLIVAIPTENSDITANAVKGRGGNVNINAQGLFGIQFRPNITDNSDITASSDFGLSGNVQINTPGVDPGKDTGELPAAPNDASNQISQTCGASQRENKFYITGRGGLPPNASEPQESEALWQDARATTTKPATTATQPAQLAPPAIGWVFERDGQVRLIAAQTAGGATKTRVVCPNQN